MIINTNIRAFRTDWVAPADWIDISNVANNEINLLVSDKCVGYAFAVTTLSGTYSIDWGDGTIEANRVSGTTYQHQYIEGAGQLCSEGYTTFKIRIYGASSNITSFKIKRTTYQLRAQNQAYLWAQFGTLGITDYSNSFYYISGSDSSKCRELKKVVIPSFTNCTTTSNMFNNCSALTYIIVPPSWGSVTNTSNMFYNCFALTSIILPTSWGSVTNTSYMFYACSSLTSIILPTSWGSVTNISNMFYTCYAMKNIQNIQYLGSLTVQSDMTDVFRDCEVIPGTITIASLLSKIGIYGAIGFNLQLTGVRLTNAGSTFTGTSPQIDVSYCNMDATSLNTLFGALPTLVGKTIKITGCLGAATCNTAIATE